MQPQSTSSLRERYTMRFCAPSPVYSLLGMWLYECFLLNLFRDLIRIFTSPFAGISPAAWFIFDLEENYIVTAKCNARETHNTNQNNLVSGSIMFEYHTSDRLEPLPYFSGQALKSSGIVPKSRLMKLNSWKCKRQRTVGSGNIVSEKQ